MEKGWGGFTKPPKSRGHHRLITSSPEHDDESEEGRRGRRRGSLGFKKNRKNEKEDNIQKTKKNSLSIPAHFQFFVGLFNVTPIG